jgi:DNA-binding NarL/FixJ family response regulator
MSRILIVEDGAIFRELLRTTLQSRFPSMEIFEVTNGKEALEQMEALLPELVFIDIRLPDMNGLELTSIIKTKHPETKVVILTNYDLPEYREAASNYKADHFIPKDTFMQMINSIFFQDPQGPQVG